MTCETVESLLLDFIESALDERQTGEVTAHLERCPRCRQALEETRALLGVLDDAKRRPVDPGRTRVPAGLPPSRPPAPAGWLPGDFLGDFEILGEIGRGGMGVVYRARQVSLNRTVALKVLSAALGQTPKAVSRFRKEAQAAAKLHHTNIVPVYAQGEQEGHFYYAMELVDGESLDRVLRTDPSRVAPTPSCASAPAAGPDGGTPSEGPPDISSGALRAGYRRLALLVAGVAEGLEHAHHQGVIHRDIKPQNLLLGADDQLHITDFGLARLVDEPSLTLSGEMLGTPVYMSPEQVSASRGKLDYRTDVYSLGVTLYELLTRRRPFDGATREQITARICTDEPRRPRKLNPAVPVDLETICLRAMEKDPRRRYGSAGEMAADLHRYAENRPILSRRVGPIERAVKWVRRHPATTAIVALSLAIAVGAPLWARQYRNRLHTEANDYVQKAFDLLAYDDYHETAIAGGYLKEAELRGPDEVPYLETLALTRLLDSPRSAVGHLRRALELQPRNTELMYLLAWALRCTEQTQESREWIRKAGLAGGDTTAAGHFFHAQAVVRTAPDEAVTAYRKAIYKRNNYAQACIHLGRAHNHWMYHERSHEQFGEQQLFLTTACEMQPGKAYPRYLLSIANRLSAEIYESSGEQSKAEERYTAALRFARLAQENEPDSRLGYTCEAEYWETQRDYPRAIACRDQEAKLCRTPEQRAEMYLYRWRLLYWGGQLKPALDDLLEFRRLCPEDDDKKIWCLGLYPALVNAELGDAEEARRSARLMAETRPTDFRAVISSAAALHVLGHADEADRLLAERAGSVRFDAGGPNNLPATWNAAVYAFCRGPKSLQEGLRELTESAGERRNDKLLWAAPCFFAGVKTLGQGDRAAALDYFRRCEQTYDYNDWCYLGRLFVRKLETDGGWPRWLPDTEAAASPTPTGDSLRP